MKNLLLIFSLSMVLLSFEAYALTVPSFNGSIDNLSGHDISDFSLTVQLSCTYETYQKHSPAAGLFLHKPTYKWRDCGATSKRVLINTDGTFESPDFKYKGKMTFFAKSKVISARVQLSLKGKGVLLEETVDSEDDDEKINSILKAFEAITVFDTKYTRVDVAKQNLKKWQRKNISRMSFELDLIHHNDSDKLHPYLYIVNKISLAKASLSNSLNINNLKNGTFPKYLIIPSQTVAKIGTLPTTMSYELSWKFNSSESSLYAQDESRTIDFYKEDLGEVFLEVGQFK